MPIVEKKLSFGTLLIYTLLTAFALACILPFILMLIVSFSDEVSVTMRGYSFFPDKWSLGAYKIIFGKYSAIPRAYGVTILVTVVGTLCNVIITFAAGYSLAQKSNLYRNKIALYFFISMIFSGGMVPWYLVSRALGCYDNIWALIVPSMLFSPFNMFLVRNFVKTIPESLNESAKLDGAGEVTIAFAVYLPLCLPVIATIALFSALGYWNNYFNAVMLVNKQALYPLQMLLFNIQSQITGLSRITDGVMRTPPKETFKMATAIVTIGPVVLVYPFLQRFFIKGIIIGAVKG